MQMRSRQEETISQANKTEDSLKKLGRGLIKNAAKDLVQPSKRITKTDRLNAFLWFFGPQDGSTFSYSNACMWANLPMEKGKESLLVLSIWSTIYSNIDPALLRLERQRPTSVRVNGGPPESH